MNATLVRAAFLLLTLLFTACSGGSPFAEDVHHAALAGNMSRIKAYVEVGGNVDTVGDGGSLLRYAALGGHVELLRYLIAKGADEKKRSFGKALIHDATESKNVAVVQFFLDRGVDVNCPTTGDSILGGKGATPLLIASKYLDYSMAAFLLRRGANVNATDEYLNTPLIEAIFLNLDTDSNPAKVFRFTKLLVEHGADVNAPDKKGSSPVALAALTENKQVVQYLVHKGATTNKQGENGETAFTYAAGNADKDLVEYFVKLGANPAARLDDGSTALMSALRSDNVDFLRWFIAKYRYNILDTDSSGQNLLLRALKECNLKTTKFLVNELKMDVNTRDVHATTPLLSAAASVDLEEMKFLLEKGSQINAQDNEGFTPLMVVAQAAYIGDSTPSNEEACYEALQYLLAHGARKDIRSKEGLIAFDYVKDQPFPSLKKLLK